MTGVAQLVGCHPTKRKVTSSIPDQGTCLGCGLRPWSGHVQEATDRCFSLTSMFLIFSFSLSSSPLKINKYTYFKKQKRENTGGIDWTKVRVQAS